MSGLSEPFELEPHREALVGGLDVDEHDDHELEPTECPECGSDDLRHDFTLGWCCLACGKRGLRW